MNIPDSRSLHLKMEDEPKVDNERCRYFWRFGWNSCRDAMLSAAPTTPPRHDGHTVFLSHKEMESYGKWLLERNEAETATPPEVSWDEAQRISDMPQVYEALSNFACDTTGDNGEAIVRAILGVIKATQPEVEPPFGYFREGIFILGPEATEYHKKGATKLYTSSPSPKGELTDNELRARWIAAGGKFHGPSVETGTMPEAELLPFLRKFSGAAS